jgi:hypothetical protein
MARPRSQRDAYKVMIRNEGVSGSGFDLVADMPASFGFGVNAQYADMFATQSIGGDQIGGGGSKAGQVTTGLVGGAVMFQPLTKKIWQGSSQIQFGMSLLFDAESNAKEQVHEIAVLLQALCLPIGVGGSDDPSSPGSGVILLPPNPPMFASNVNRTSIRIGKMFYFHDVVLEGVSYNLESRFAADGYPIAGQVDIEVTTSYVYSRQDLLAAANMFNYINNL